eukprot:7937666-Pyramimonas_sp.AAC.2
MYVVTCHQFPRPARPPHRPLTLSPLVHILCLIVPSASPCSYSHQADHPPPPPHLLHPHSPPPHPPCPHHVPHLSSLSAGEAGPCDDGWIGCDQRGMR